MQMFRQWLILFSALLILASSAQAGLPFSADGEKLPSLAPILERSTPAVVNILTRATVKTQRNPLLDDPFFKDFFNLQPQRKRQTQGLGSGVIVDAKNGYILTNNHVIKGADIITVTLRDGRQLDAKLVGTDPGTDISVLKVESDNLVALPLADSEKLRVGDFVIAIGNPFGLGQTVTSGIVSALDRSGLGIGRFEDYIQTDASINPGNSGGALIDLRGHLVGINNAIYSRTGSNIGIGFAIPINMARDIMAQLIETGSVQRGRLGAQAQDLTPELAKAFNLEPNSRGAIVVKIISNSPADKAGLRIGDVVRAVNKKSIHKADDLHNTIGLLRVGTKVNLTVLRDSKQLMISATISKSKQTKIDAGELHKRLGGAEFSSLGEDHPAYGKLDGIVISVVKPRSPAAAAGLREGDVITKINKQTITSPAQAKKLASKSQRGIRLSIIRGRSSLTLLLQ